MLHHDIHASVHKWQQVILTSLWDLGQAKHLNEPLPSSYQTSASLWSNIRQLLSGIRRETAYRSTCSVAWLPLSAQNWGGFLSFAGDFLDPQLLHMASSICFSSDPQSLLLHQPIQVLSWGFTLVHLFQVLHQTLPVNGPSKAQHLCNTSGPHLIRICSRL